MLITIRLHFQENHTLQKFFQNFTTLVLHTITMPANFLQSFLDQGFRFVAWKGECLNSDSDPYLIEVIRYPRKASEWSVIASNTSLEAAIEDLSNLPQEAFDKIGTPHQESEAS